jgi:glycosyltransferase involved in cell wall biosynthesis
MYSVIMPAFNQEKYIGAAITSVLNQTYTNWELIVVDNYSTDKTIEIISAFKDPRVQCLSINNGGIIAKSRNLGITKSVGDYIAFLDSDDLWEGNKLELVNLALQDGVDTAYHDVVIIDEESNITGAITSRSLRSNSFDDLITTGNILVNSSVVVRKKSLLDLGGISEEKSLVGMEDFNTWLRLAQKGNSFTHLALKLGSYRVHSENTSGSLDSSDLSGPTYAGLDQYTSSKQRRLRNRNFYYHQGCKEFSRQNFMASVMFFKLAYKHRENPCDFKPLLRLALAFCISKIK